MPKILERCVAKKIKEGVDKSSAFAICTASLKKAGKLTDEKARQQLSEAGFESHVIDLILDDGFSIMSEIRLGETVEDDDFGELTEIEMIKTGEFLHRYYGGLTIDKKLLNSFRKNFRENVLGRDIAFDTDHYPEKGATAWLRKLRTKKRTENGKETFYLIGQVELTTKGRAFIENKEYKYFSLDYHENYKDKEEEEKFYGPTIMGGALTNRPFIPGLRPIKVGDKIQLSENLKGKDFAFEEVDESEETNEPEEVNTYVEKIEEEKYPIEEVERIELATVRIRNIPWSKVDKSKLPSSAFAEVPDPKKKSTWKLPYKNPDGSLNPNGVSAAVAALKGARQKGGKPMSVSAKARKKINTAWAAVKKWREAKKNKTNLNDKEAISVKAIELLKKQLAEHQAVQESLEEGSDEFKDLAAKIASTEEAIKELSDKSEENPEKGETDAGDTNDDTQLSDTTDETEKTKEKEKVELSETEKENIKLKEMLENKDKEIEDQKTELSEQSKENEKRFYKLELENRRANVNTDVIKFRDMGIPKPMIDLYKEVALSDEGAEVVKLSDGDHKGDHTVTGIIGKMFAIMPEDSRVSLSEETDASSNEDEGKALETELMEMATANAKKISEEAVA